MCTGDTKFGVRIVTNLGHQIWCPGDTKFFTVYDLEERKYSYMTKVQPYKIVCNYIRIETHACYFSYMDTLLKVIHFSYS